MRVFPRVSRNSGKIAAILGWSLFGLIVLLVVALVGARAWVFRYLAGPEFQEMLGRKTSQFLRVEGGYQPLQVSGTSIFTNGFRGTGTEGSAVRQIEAEQLRAHLDARAAFGGVWRVDSLTAQRLKLRLTKAAEESEHASSTPPRQRGRSWLPSKVEVERMEVQNLDVAWDSGESVDFEFSGLQAKAENLGDDGWRVLARSGMARLGTFPEMSVEDLNLRIRDGTVFITTAHLRKDADGEVAVTGRVGNGVDLDAEIKRIPLSPYLSAEWRSRVSGLVEGYLEISREHEGAMKVGGVLRLREGEIKSVPMLDQIAEFTRTQRFRQFSLTDVEMEFENVGERTVAKRFVAESEGLIRVEGTFSLEAGRIDGVFQVGVTPANLQWLPGAQDKVFTERRDGYVWTPMRVTGPVDRPREDLSERLVVAAGGAVIEGVEGSVRDATRTLLDMARPLLE